MSNAAIDVEMTAGEPKKTAHEHLQEYETPKIATALSLHLFLLKQFAGLSAVVVYGVLTTK
jgi:hypothetical protein